MDTRPICSGCRKPLAANAPEGLCPECLLKAGLGTGVDLGPETRSVGGRIPFVAPSLAEMALRFPQLEILSLIGQGGMGAVYRARQKQLDRVVALKILPPGIGSDPAFAERFTREARALARLNHPGVVTLYEFGQIDSLCFFLMEFVDGVNLRQLLEGGRLSPREALAIVPQICDALQYAHDQGIVHRDIKPENILLDRQGRVKMADFGLAKLMGAEALSHTPDREDTLVASVGKGDEARSERVLTDADKVMGTPAYMAPEQRQRPTEVDHRADIYSLGVVFYQMLTGELPGRRIEPPSKTVHIDVRLDGVVLRALEQEPQRRYQHASEVKADIETIAASPPAPGTVSTAPVLSEPRISDPARRPGPAPLSRKAVVGALWAPFFLIPLLSLFVVRVALDGTPPRPEWWQSALMVVLLPLGLTAPFATPILGGLALSEIRRSAGRLSGLGLALFDVLFFLLLALDALIAWLLIRTLQDVAHGTVLDSPPVLTALAIAVAGAVDALIVVRAWRAANRPPQTPPASAVIVDRAEPALRPVRPDRPSNLTIGALLGLILGALAAGFGASGLAWFLAPPVLFTWFLLFGHRVAGVDLDAGVQFWLGAIGLPACAALGALLTGAVQLLRPTEPAAQSRPAGWSRLSIAAATTLALSLPLGGATLVMGQLIARDSHWNPGSGELTWTLALGAGAGLLAAGSVLLGLAATRQIRGAEHGLRGGRAARAATWFWPCLAGITLAFGLLHGFAHPIPRAGSAPPITSD